MSRAATLISALVFLFGFACAEAGVLKRGAAKVGQWVEETADIARDYRKAFGFDPPPTASIAIMNDSDNTGEASVSYVEFIEILNP
jgi:hypothetical protein